LPFISSEIIDTLLGRDADPSEDYRLVPGLISFCPDSPCSLIAIQKGTKLNGVNHVLLQKKSVFLVQSRPFWPLPSSSKTPLGRPFRPSRDSAGDICLSLKELEVRKQEMRNEELRIENGELKSGKMVNGAYVAISTK
jgi:hypothetical protein